MSLPRTGHRRPRHDDDLGDPLSDRNRPHLRRPRLRPPPPCHKEQHVAKPASAQTRQRPAFSSFEDYIKSIGLEGFLATSSPSPQAVAHDTIAVSPPSTCCLSSSPGSSLLARTPRDWGLTFYIRADLGGSFHTYPHLGGPFQSLQEVNNAIDRYLHDHRDPRMCKEQDGVSLVDMAIRQTLYWPDGRRRKCSKSQVIEQNRNQMRLLTQALVDKYNEDHNLLGDLAYELKDVLHYQFIFESHSAYSRTYSKGNRYYHLNFTTKTKGAGDFDCDMDNLFFVELTLMPGEYQEREMVVSCFCTVKPNDNGHCYGCTNNGSVDMKHPDNADAYAGGHLNVRLPCGDGREWSDSDDDPDAEEARLRRIYKGLGRRRPW